MLDNFDQIFCGLDGDREGVVCITGRIQGNSAQDFKIGEFVPKTFQLEAVEFCLVFYLLSSLVHSYLLF